MLEQGLSEVERLAPVSHCMVAALATTVGLLSDSMACRLLQTCEPLELREKWKILAAELSMRL